MRGLSSVWHDVFCWITGPLVRFILVVFNPWCDIKMALNVGEGNQWNIIQRQWKLEWTLRILQLFRGLSLRTNRGGEEAGGNKNIPEETKIRIEIARGALEICCECQMSPLHLQSFVLVWSEMSWEKREEKKKRHLKAASGTFSCG